MARAFVRASSQFLSTTVLPVSTTPLTMACWAWVNDITQEHTLMSLSDTGTAAGGFHLQARGATANDPLTIRTLNALGTINNYPTGQWFHAAGVIVSNISRTAYLNGVAGTLNASNATPVAINTFNIGRRDNTTADHLDGRVAWAALWDIDLTAAEIASLAAGAYPPRIRPADIVAFWPLFGRHDPDRDLIGGAGLTVTGATAVEHPRIVSPRWPGRGFISIGGPAAALEGAATLAITTASALTTGIPLASATATLALTSTAALTTGIPLASATATLALTGTAALTTSIRLESSIATLAITTAAGLTAGTGMDGAATLALTASGALTTAIQAAGSATLALTTTGTLSAGSGLTAASTLALTGVGTLTTAIRLVGASALTLSATGSFEAVGAALAGSAALALQTTGALTTGISLAGAPALVLTTAAAPLTTAIRLQATSTLALTTTATLILGEIPVLEGGRSYATDIRYALASVTAVSIRWGDTHDVEDLSHA